MDLPEGLPLPGGHGRPDRVEEHKVETPESEPVGSAHPVARKLLALDAVARDPVATVLVPILARPTRVTSSGYPFLEKDAWDALRDRVPLLFRMGLRVLAVVEAVEGHSGEVGHTGEAGLSAAARDNLERACRVARQVVLTAAITAPTDLWLLHHLLGTFASLGLLDRLLLGEAIYPGCCEVVVAGRVARLRSEELEKDLHFLLSRGIVEQYEDSYRIAGHPRVRHLLGAINPAPGDSPVGHPGSLSGLWRQLFGGATLAGDALEALLEHASYARPRSCEQQNHWIPTLEEVEIGYRLVPIVLGLRAHELTQDLAAGRRVVPTDWSSRHPVCAGGALEVLTSAGWMERDGEGYRVTQLGERGFARGPGPFGIIEAYQPYLANGVEILVNGPRGEWVRRGDNVGASQDANRRTFAQANDALDRFCADTGFSYDVFIEHAIGRGEATRQRLDRDGADRIRYVGADLEDAAIDAAEAEKARGNLPRDQVFVRQADIGQPQILIDALRAYGAESEGAVMLVGNGFHEVREQTDERMVDVFRGYHDAGIVLLFTEENALAIDDLRATAWNTFHAGFRYVHEKSGQGLRPADARPPVRLGAPLRAAWSACARRAGYVRADAYCTRTRTVYPYTPASGINPAISVNHFFVPARIAAHLNLSDGSGISA